MPENPSTFEKLPNSLKARLDDDIAILALARIEKRNALDDATILGIEQFFDSLPQSVRAVVIHAEGEHFSAGLDLSELTKRSASEAIAHSRNWHRVFHKFEFGALPVVAVLHGAVVGGGFEFAASCHIRVAERSAYYALPEGSRGIFVGGGGSVRISRLIGMSRMREMMMTGRTYSAEEGQALGLSHYLVACGDGLKKGIELARRAAQNASLTNFALINALPRIVEVNSESGFLMEALMSSIASSDPEAQARLEAFFQKRAPKATPTP